MTDHADILTIATAAAEFGYTRQAFSQAVKAGRLHAFTIGGSRGLFTTRAAVAEAISAGLIGKPRARRKGV
jgi:hypothetical protein